MAVLISNKSVRSRDGVDIVYSVAGDTNPAALVFIHGGLADRRVWASQMQPFAGRHRVIALDLAGHGESGCDRANWGIREFGEDVVAVVHAEKLSKVVLIGNSLGGPVAMEAAALLGPKAAGVIGVDTFQDMGRKIEPAEAMERAEAFRKDFPGMVRQMLNMLFHPDVDPALFERLEKEMNHNRPDVMYKMFLSFGDYDPRPAIDRVSAPVRSINGDRFPTDIEAIRKVKPDFDAVVFPHTGHYPMLECPDKFNEALSRFVDEMLRTGGR